MSKSTHQFEIKGVDKTAGAFSSIKNSAKVTASQISAIVGGAVTAAGAYFGFKSIMGGVDKLGKLSDVAQTAGVSVDELTKAAAAFDVVGIKNMGVDEIAKSFSMLAKNTGRTGLEGFLRTVEDIGGIGDVSKRSEAAVKALGESGLRFMPLINAAKDGTAAIRGVIDVMPGVSQAAADAGDKMADAKNIGAHAFQSIWLKAIGAVCGLFHTDVRGGMVSMAAYAEYGSAAAWRYIKAFFTSNEQGITHLRGAWQAVCNSVVRSVVIMSATCYEYMKTLPERFVAGVAGGIMGLPAIVSSKYRAWYNGIMKDWTSDISQGMWKSIDDDLKSLGVSMHETLGQSLRDVFSDVDTSDLKKRLDEVLQKAEAFNKNYTGATLTSDARRKMDLMESKDDRQPTRISNELIMGGSNAMTKLQILGPSLQTERKKTNELLQKIVENTEKTADNTDGGEELDTID